MGIQVSQVTPDSTLSQKPVSLCFGPLPYLFLWIQLSPVDYVRTVTMAAWPQEGTLGMELTLPKDSQEGTLLSVSWMSLS